MEQIKAPQILPYLVKLSKDYFAPTSSLSNLDYFYYNLFGILMLRKRKKVAKTKKCECSLVM